MQTQYRSAFFISSRFIFGPDMSEIDDIDVVQCNRSFFGPSAQREWTARGNQRPLDVALITHPRDAADVARLFPWAAALDAARLTDLLCCLQPVYGEIIEAGDINIGIIFLPILAQDMTDPRKRASSRKCLEQQGLAKAAELGARHVCLGGLTGALSNYGRRISARAQALGIALTTGHAATAVSIVRQYDEAIRQAGIAPDDATVAILGVGSVGAGVGRLFTHSARVSRPGHIVLVDTAAQEQRLQSLAAEIAGIAGIAVSIERLETRGTLPPDSRCYLGANVVISAVSTAYVLDPERVAPGTILIDDSQPYCWARGAAYARMQRCGDLLPCDAGLVDASALGYRSRFPFDFADDVGQGSTVSWSCLAEGILRVRYPGLPGNIGEAEPAQLLAYDRAFDEAGLAIPPLQCGRERLNVAQFRAYRAQRVAANSAEIGGIA